MRNLVRQEQFVELEEDVLRALEGERRDHEVAAGIAHAVDLRGEQPRRVLLGRMEPVAVGGFDEQVIGLRRKGGVLKDGHVPSADVAGENDRGFLPVPPDDDPDERSAEDVADVIERRLDSVGDADRLAVLRRREAALARARVLDAVERRFGMLDRPAFLPMPVLLEPRALFLQPRGVLEDEPRDLGGGRGAVQPAAESFAIELGEEAAMIEVRVREKGRLDRIRRDRKRLPVARLELAFLAEAAVHEEPGAVRFEQVSGTGDGLRRAEESQFDLHDSAFSP